MMVLGVEHVMGVVSQFKGTQIWKDDGAFKLYLYCLSQASQNAHEWYGIALQPGDMPFSERRAAKALCWSRNKLDRKLKILVASGHIIVRSATRKGTIVHIVHWQEFSELHDGDAAES